MKFSKILIVTLASLLVTSSAFASALWTVTATTGDGSPLSAITPGTTITFDIGLTTSAAGELNAISGSVNDYNSSIVSFTSAPVFATTIMNSVCFPSAGCFNGVANLEADVREETGVEGAGNEDTFLSVLSVTPAAGDGTVDDPNPQFQLVYTVNPLAAELASTTIRIGTYGDYADAYTGQSDSVVTNAEFVITVPEPTSVAASLASLASVIGVVAVRRRG